MIDLDKFDSLSKEELEKLKKASGGGDPVYFIEFKCSNGCYCVPEIATKEIPTSYGELCPQCGQYTLDIICTQVE